MPKKKEAYVKSLNLLRLFLYLKQHKAGVSVNEICEEFFGESSVRTIQRFVKAVKETIMDDDGHHIFYIIDTNSDDGKKKLSLNPKYLTGDKVEFEEQQVFSIMLADCLMANIKKAGNDLKSDVDITDIRTEIINFLAKKSADLAEEESGDEDFDDSKFHKEVNAEKILKNLKAKFYSKKIGYKIYAEDENATKVLDAVTNALYKSCKVKLSYKSRNSTENKEHIIKPYTLLEHNGVYYIMGAFDNSTKPSLFSIDRIKSAKMLKDTFVVPKGYSPASVIERGVGVGDYDDKPMKVELLFRKEVAYYITERFWHTTQQIEKLNDGTVKLSLLVPVSLELNKLILSFGSMVKVLSPKELALEIKEDRSVQLYNDVKDDTIGKEKFLHIIVHPKERPSEQWPVKWDAKGKKPISIITKKEVADECKIAQKACRPIYVHKSGYSNEQTESHATICCCACVDKVKELDEGKYEVVFKEYELLNQEPVCNYKKLDKGSYYFC